MAKSVKDIKTITEALEHLEKTGTDKAKDIKEVFGENFEEIKKAFENLKPSLDSLEEKISSEAKKTKNEVEAKVKENPWLVIGVVAFIAFIVGCFITRKRD